MWKIPVLFQDEIHHPSTIDGMRRLVGADSAVLSAVRAVL